MAISALAGRMMESVFDDSVYSRDAIFAYLSRLLAAPAPNSGARLPGAVGQVIGEIADEMGLSLSTNAGIRATGNLAIEIGAEGEAVDLLMTAHMDRPTFRVLNLGEGTLYPLCAIRVPGDGYACGAIAVRYDGGAVKVVSRGEMRFRAKGADYEIRYVPASGRLGWGDSVLMAAEARLRGGMVMGSGLDNACGVLLALLSARALSCMAEELTERGRKIIIAFTEQEEGPPSGLFGQGASRLARVLSSPRMGFINIDAHNVDASLGHVPGIGASHAFVSGYGRGSVVALEYQALAEGLAEAVNRGRPGAVRLNHGYVSRSDDMLLSLHGRCLGLIGVVLENAHTAEEAVALDDVAAAARWVSVFAAALLE